MTGTTVFNWHHSPAHIWFLTTFLKPRKPDDDFQGVDWKRALGEPPSQVIKRFRKLVLITESPLSVRLDAQFTAVQLKELCRQHKLPLSGKKDELIFRLVQVNDPIIYSAVSIEMYQCSDHGRKLAERYLEDPNSVINAVEDLPEEQDSSTEQLNHDELMRLLRWLLLEGIVLGVAGNAVYDLLKTLATAAGRSISDILPDFSLIDPGRVSYLTNSLKIEWCHVPAGRFLMGSTKRDSQVFDDEKPQHRVYVPAFYIAKYPITNAQYVAFVNATGHRTPWNWKDGHFPRHKINHPVSVVNWHDTITFCEWASRVTRRRVRLPSEAEWEKAARGTDGRSYPWGSFWNAKRCNSENRFEGTTQVNHFPDGRSPYGAYDMAGNVREWTSTIYKPYPYNEQDGRENMQDDKQIRVLRGGGWWSSAQSLRCAYRYRYGPYYLRRGFRVVVSPF